MNKLLVLDFNRTIYDPDKSILIDGAVELIKSAQEKGYTLVLLAKAAQSRAELIQGLGIKDYFAELILTDNKTLKHLHDLEAKYKTTPETSLLIGDRTQGEIALGHLAGWKTIWVKNGRFKDELPEGFEPSHTVNSLTDAALFL